MVVQSNFYETAKVSQTIWPQLVKKQNTTRMDKTKMFPSYKKTAKTTWVWEIWLISSTCF